MTKEMQSWLVLIIVSTIVAGLTLWRMGLMPGSIPSPRMEAPPAAAPGSPPAQPSASTEPESAIKHPLAASRAQPLNADEVGRALIDFLGKDAVESFLQIDEFPRRFVATVDNLGRSHAPHAFWPVHPTAEQFKVDEVDDASAIGVDNDQRYVPFVLLAETVNPVRAVDLYARLYPLMQRAYEELGYPNKYFNDRLISVIDLMLATPEMEYPIKVHLMEVKGPIPSLRPWIRYEFSDPELERLSAGQKILLRIGPVNERRLKAKLAQIRDELVKRQPTR